MAALNALIPDRLSRYVALLGLAAYLAGSFYALAESKPFMFQRFGSIGVAAAVLFFTDRLLQIELNRQKTVERILHEYGIELEAMKAGVSPSDLPMDGILIDYLEEEARFGALRDRADRINTANVALLTLGTLQWGFGDVFLNWILP